ERALYERFLSAEHDYLQEQMKIVALVRQGDFDAALVVAAGQLNQHADGMARALGELALLNRNGASDAALRAGEVFESARVWVIGMMILAVLGTVILALLLTRSIVTPLAEAVRVAEVVASGDLTQEIQVT